MYPASDNATTNLNKIIDHEHHSRQAHHEMLGKIITTNTNLHNDDVLILCPQPTSECDF